MAISDIFDSICCCSCGLCCSKEVLCDTCEVSTLKANGLPLEYAPEIHGLSKENRSVFSEYRFDMSKLAAKLRELHKREKEKYDNR